MIVFTQDKDFLSNKMKLYKLKYQENFNIPNVNPWEIEEIIFNGVNLLVGKNATGKSRTIRIINEFARFIRQERTIKNAHWTMEFHMKNDSVFIYKLQIENGIVISEKITENGIKKLNRTKTKTEIYSVKIGEMHEINPPLEKIVLQVRRDENEYPFLEEIANWANGVHGYFFGNTHPNEIEISNKDSGLVSLNAVPSILSELKEKDVKQIIKDFKKIGYSIDSAQTKEAPGKPLSVKMIYLKESELDFEVNQAQISQGMFRAFALLTIIQHTLSKKTTPTTILIDDICEGLDYDRATKFTKLIFEKIKKHEDIQLIVSSNDRFLMNAVDIKHWNILERKKNKITSSNYTNSKELFDDFMLTGMNNFDLFTSNFLQKK